MVVKGNLLLITSKDVLFVRLIVIDILNLVDVLTEVLGIVI